MKQDLELDINGYPLNVSCQYLCHEWTENYREDIDGNRGKKTTFREINTLSIFDSRGNEIGQKLEEKYPDIYQDVINMLLEVEE